MNAVTHPAYEGEAQGATWWFPVVHSVNAHRRKTTWQISVTGHGEKCPVDSRAVDIPISVLLTNQPLPAGYYASIKVDSGVEGGKTRATAPTLVAVGKYAGNKNATNAFCQAMNEARGKYNNQVRKAATPVSIHGVRCLPPMLAQECELAKLKYPVWLQYKYDGLRAVAALAPAVEGCTERRVVMYTRTRVEIMGLDHIKKALLPVLLQHPTWYLDGEVYKHGVSLQTISGFVREETPSPEATMLDYILYDCFLEGDEATWEARLARLGSLVVPPPREGWAGGAVVITKTWKVANEGELAGLYKEALDAGYEGAIIRKNGPYELSYNNRHSKYLLKLKPEADAEFEIVSWKTGGKGKTLGAFIVVCRTADGKQFSVNPAMPIADRVTLADTMKTIELNGKTHFENDWLGKFVTVKYASLSDDGVPLQPRTSLHKRID